MAASGNKTNARTSVRFIGHGKQFLSCTLAGLMMLAFLIDQIQEQAYRYSSMFKKAVDLKIRMDANASHDEDFPNTGLANLYYAADRTGFHFDADRTRC